MLGLGKTLDTGDDVQLTAQQLRRNIPAAELSFASTEELPEYRHILGQPRATEALQFGLGINQPGYNLYVAGENGLARTRYITEYLEPLAAHKATPQDWLYVNNFETASEPRCISLPRGLGVKFQRDIGKLIDEIMATFPAIFENPAYIQQKNALQNAFDHQYDAALSIVEKAATEKQVAVYREAGSITFSVMVDGQIADDAYFGQMNDKERDQFHESVVQLERLLSDVLLELPQWQRDLNNKLRDLLQTAIRQALKQLFEDLHQQYHGHAGVMIYLAQVNQHLPRVIEEHFTGAGDDKDTPPSQRQLLEQLYRPNLLIRNANQLGAPIVFEPNPTYANLFGQINLASQQHGEVKPGHQHIVSGALHRANGGYLLVDVEKVLADGETWRALKRALREGSINIEAFASETMMATPYGLRPEPIPLAVKVILIGPREIYYALADVDHEFYELFRVLVDFNSDFDYTHDNLRQFAAMLHTRSKEAGTAELTAAAIARVAEYACRLADDQRKLSTRIDLLVDIVVESDYWRQLQASELIDVGHIEQAISAREYRHDRLRERLNQDILAGFVTIATSGIQLGQVNGLAVIHHGEASFGCPLRITATAHPGSKGVVDIEREVELGQAVHSKGVLLLTGYLCGRYARDFSLTMSAHIAVEQSYGYIDGDSASLAELCALLSVLAATPLRQDIAITGSVSQFGEVQAVGGVNEKIEGFYDICKARGLTGEQGVIIPAANQCNLMLADRVVAAVARGEFAIYAVAQVDEAIELLTRECPGQLDEYGIFAEQTFNRRIVDRLQRFSTTQKHD